VKRILCATDLSPRCESAVHRAGMVAQQHGARLALLHVIDAAQTSRLREQEQERATARLRSRTAPPLWPFETAPTIEVRAGQVAKVIRDVAEESGADLIVLGARRRRAVRDACIGTTGERVLRTCGCATLQVNRDPTSTYRNVLLALDSSAVSARAVQMAESFVLGDDARVSVIHAFAPPYEGKLTEAGVSEAAIARHSMQWGRSARAQIAALLEETGSNPDRFDIIVDNAAPLAAITQAVERSDPDLLIIGTRGPSLLRRLFLSNIASSVLREMKCDVLVASLECKDKRATSRSSRTYECVHAKIAL
jgi:universal stress protein E